MSFKSWALANPTKTADYIDLQQGRDNTQRNIAESEAKIVSYQAGNPPDWYEEEPSYLKHTMLSKSFDVMEALQFRAIGISDEEAEIAMKERKQKKWEREAIEAEENK